MFLTGILSVLQITLLPGFILLHLFNIKTESRIQKYLYIFGLSLFTNYSVVTLLTISGIYTSIVLYVIIVVELMVITLLIKSKKNNLSINFNFKDALINYIAFLKSNSRLNRYLFISAGLIILFYFALFISNLGTIFYFVDTVNNIHWNTWAIDFANNILPRRSSHFPQLIPANWSVAYVLTDNTYVNFFPKSFMPLFFFGNLLMFLDLALWKRNSIFIIALIIYGLFAPVIYSLVFIADGNGDLPVSFFALLAFYVFLRMDKNKFETSERILFFLFAATAAATKLAGFYIFVFASVISFYGLIKFFREIKKSDLVLISLVVPFVIVICFFWHFLKPDVMVSGLHQPEWVGENYLLIFIKASKLMYYNWGLPVLAFLLITIFFSLSVKESRYITLVMVIPPLILWMLKYSADFRNLSFVVPFISYVSAYGLIRIIEISGKKNPGLVFETSPAAGPLLSNKEKMIGWTVAAVFVIAFFVISSDFFYNLLADIYKFISMYYYQSHRINLLVDYTPFTSIDYYQNVFAAMCLTAAALIVFAFIKLNLKQFLAGFGVLLILFNFLYASEENIVRCQQKGTEQVDARNYAAWLNTIVQSSGLDKNIHTNFKAISAERQTGKLSFSFSESNELEEMLISGSQGKLFFIKTDLISSDFKSVINEKAASGEINILFDDGSYIFFILET
jgi:hypothetical protein